MNQIIPTKSNLLAVQRSLSLARLGYDLMDRKRNILVREMMTLLDRANDLQSRIDDTFQSAYIHLQIANITLGFSEQVARSVPIDDGVELQFRSVMGVELPTVNYKDSRLEGVPYGFVSTNTTLDMAYRSFDRAKTLCRELAEVENSIYLLAVATKKAQKRANSLKNIVIPRLENTVDMIRNDLEEKEREEFTRLKVIKRNMEKRTNRVC